MSDLNWVNDLLSEKTDLVLNCDLNSDSVNGYLNRFNDKVDNFILLKEQGKTALKGRETTLLEDGGLFLWYFAGRNWRL